MSQEQELSEELMGQVQRLRQQLNAKEAQREEVARQLEYERKEFKADLAKLETKLRAKEAECAGLAQQANTAQRQLDDTRQSLQVERLARQQAETRLVESLRADCDTINRLKEQLGREANERATFTDELHSVNRRLESVRDAVAARLDAMVAKVDRLLASQTEGRLDTLARASIDCARRQDLHSNLGDG